MASAATLPRVHAAPDVYLPWQLAVAELLISDGDGVEPRPQGDRRDVAPAAWREAPRSREGVRLRLQVLHERQVIEGMDLRVNRPGQPIGRTGRDPVAVQLVEVDVRARYHRDPGLTRLGQGRPDGGDSFGRAGLLGLAERQHPGEQRPRRGQAGPERAERCVDARGIVGRGQEDGELETAVQVPGTMSGCGKVRCG